MPEPPPLPTEVVTEQERRLLALLRGVAFGSVTITKKHGTITLIERRETVHPDDL